MRENGGDTGRTVNTRIKRNQVTQFFIKITCMFLLLQFRFIEIQEWKLRRGVASCHSFPRLVDGLTRPCDCFPLLIVVFVLVSFT